MNILLLEEDEIDLPARDPRARHVRKVLGLGVGDSLRAGIVNGPAGTAVIEVIDSRHMRIRFDPDGSAVPTAEPQVDMILGHPRPIVLKRMLRDLGTVGIRRLIVVPTALGEKSYLASTMWARIRPLLIEGAAQAGSTRLMEVERCNSISEGVAAAKLSDQLKVLLHPDSPDSMNDVFAAGNHSSILLAVGSERGWTMDEVQRLTSEGFILATMGVRTLRTESAAVVAGWVARATAVENVCDADQHAT